jgi:hypothetical protein
MNFQNLLFFDKKGDQYNFVWNGNYWEGAILFPIVSEKLFEVQHIFIIEKFLNPLSEIKYGFPHSYGVSPGPSVWRTRWESDYDGSTNVSSIIYTYELGVDGNLDAPVLVKANNVEFYPEIVPGDVVASPSGLVVSSDISPSSMQINIALNSDSEGIYDRRLIIEDYTDPNNPVTILKVELHGEVEGEDSRLSVTLSNFGRSFNPDDALIVRESDIKEEFPDYEIINKKRKELLLAGESIFPYLGSYKSLFNAIKFFGYYDLRVKEYWLNIKTDEADTLTPLQQNQKILNQLSQPNIEGLNKLELISSLIKDENQGKFKQVEIYGKKKDGTFGLKKQFESLFPSKSYKKTALFGLFYDINRVVEDQEEDQYGYPIVEDAFAFSPEEVLIKLFGLKQRLKRDYLPLNARIIDITGEGVYFNLYKTRGWTDVVDITEIKGGIKVGFNVYPERGYVEDLRPFYTKPNQSGLLYPNINGVEEGISYYGNTVDPYSYFQEYPISTIPSLENAVNLFYQDITNGEMPKFLGDGDYDPPGYKLFSDGSDYVFPAGCPVIIKNDTFNLSWEELSGSWNSLDPTITRTDLQIASYSSTTSPNPGGSLQTVYSTSLFTLPTTFPVGININIGAGNNWFDTTFPDVIFVRVESVDSPGNLVLGYCSAGDYNTLTGNLYIQMIYTRGSGEYSNWKVSPTNLGFSSYVFDYYENFIQSNGFYSWNRLPYLDFYEIEWTIYKDDDDKPYYYQTRGGLPELETIVHFLPYSGEYNIKCRVWDTLNSISLGIKRGVVKVDKRGIELNTLTRFRESESYDWNNMPLKWESYPSQWIFPVENTNKILSISDFIQNYPEYSNNFNEGQQCEVLTKLPEVKSTVTFDVGVQQIDISTIVSNYIGGGYDLAEVTTITPHGYSSGDTVWIYDSLGSSLGQYPITVTGANTFQIPEIIITAITGGYVYGTGNIKFYADAVLIADCNFQGDLNSTTSLAYSIINSSPLDPKYKVINLVDSVTTNYKTFTVQAPNNSGSLWNGKQFIVQTTGSLLITTPINTFSGGLNEREEYVYYDFNLLPKKEMRYWGTKSLSWETFEDFSFEKAYAHTWDMYDYHNDWLGGFNLYSLQYGDRVKVTEDSNGLVFGETDSPGNNYLDLKEAADQLNNSIDENIKRFDYVVRGFSELPNNFYPNANPISPDLSTNPGPKNIQSKFYKVPTYSPVLFEPTGIAWDADGDIWVTGEDVIKFDGVNYTNYDSSNSVMPGVSLLTNCIKIDRNDIKWIGLENNLVPLVKINEKDPSDSFAYSVNDFVDNGGNPISPITPSSINCIEINPQRGDIFAGFTCNSSPSYDGLLFYDSSAKSWNLYTTSNSDIPSDNIRDLKLQYYSINKWYLWIATDNGISRFDGVNFKNYNTGNSGIPSNNVYSIELDKLNHKWIGTSDGLVYWDDIRWAVWNNATNPELNLGSVKSIIETGNSNIWFTIDSSSSPSSTELYYFDGYYFTKVLYRNDGTTLINPVDCNFGKISLSAPWKTIKNGETTFPKNLLILTKDGEIGKIDYIIPHIQATSKDPGTNGWDFIYHNTSSPLPSVEYIFDSGIGTSQLGFNFIVGPYYDNITLNSDYTRPIMPNVDRYSWYKPIWQRYSIDRLKYQFPSLNIDDVFLYAPLRDILNDKANKEPYWKNSQIERIAKKKSRDLFDNFEWVITLGNSNPDQGVKVTVDNEGDIIAIGDFTGTIFMGEVNNIGTQDLYLTSLDQGVYIAKYNKGGVIQWARSIASTSPQGPIYARSVITDTNGNIYVVSDNNLTGFIQIDKFNFDGVLLNSLNIPITPDQYIGDIKVDKYENIYICGGFQGNLILGSSSLISTGQDSGFLAKLDPSMTFVWAKQFTNTTYSKAYEIGILKEEYLYLTGVFDSQIDLGPIQLTGVGNPDMFIAKFYTGDGECLWANSIGYDSSTSFGSSSICLDPNGHVLISGSYEGTIKIENQTLSSFPGTTDIFVIKLLSTGKLIWMKMCGGSGGDTAHDIESDSDENVYITGSYTSPAYFSPEEIESRGGTDIYLTKFNKDGLLVDIVTAGGINNDSGADLVLDKEENIYITGYFEGESEFSPYVILSPPGGNLDAFLGKIPKERFKEGNKIGSVQSWLGSHAWSWKEEKFYRDEFEIPLATTIFINPIDSLIPGKKDHIWTLSDTETGEVIVKIRKSPYFIWTFLNPGFYSIACELQDANGNIYETSHSGKIRVIDHKEAFAGDLKPEVVNPDDYLLRTIYYDRKELGFPPLSRFQID